MQITAELEHYHDVYMYIYIDGKMVVYIITIHLYIHRIYDLGRVWCVLDCHFYITSTYNDMNIKKEKSEIFISYQLILISCMNTYDNLCNLLTIIINERSCLNDEKKTNTEEC